MKKKLISPKTIETGMSMFAAAGTEDVPRINAASDTGSLCFANLTKIMGSAFHKAQAWKLHSAPMPSMASSSVRRQRAY